MNDETELKPSLRRVRVIYWSTFTLVKTIFCGLFILALLLTVWEIKLYHSTIIPVAYPLLLWFAPGLLLTPVLYRFLEQRLNITSLFLKLVYNVATWGGLVVFFFMAINFYLARGEVVSKQFKIVDKGKLSKGGHGCGEPYADITYEGKSKQIVFGCDIVIDNVSQVALQVEKGFLGFDIIVKQTAF